MLFLSFLTLVGVLVCTAHPGSPGHGEDVVPLLGTGVHQQHDEHHHASTQCNSTTTKDRRTSVDVAGPEGGGLPPAASRMTDATGTRTAAERLGRNPSGRQRLLLTCVARN
ncbi:hypothetical protein GCM10027290_45120 [Micromonospora sonneratiae]|uniref:Secreted protein n=1 Tax=Micromonospora sonneratiae TaxID=1184706 RepID=A0ABW3Y6Z6_9ACTN